MRRYSNTGRARAFYPLNPDRTLFHTPTSLHVMSRTDRQLILEGLMDLSSWVKESPFEEDTIKEGHGSGIQDDGVQFLQAVSYEEIFKCKQSTCILPLKPSADRTLFHTPSSLYVLSRTDRQLISEGLMAPDKC
ncbi:hypothetical protein CDAR_102911 [Caerostris darwini]|uniref:Uncharacterized protein n=1 Tax=Caerostris darwini TaxID=1538125 RepID=A0AAV4PI03_9ARAC|nr:hypothetical protein CDAR_102911 [Caerostris darwini]